jgi:hypothetical protein
MSLAPKGKLQPRFFGPYRVTEIINEAAVRLELPPQAKIHDVFHVGLLKKWVGEPPASVPALPELLHGAALPEPERVVRSRLARGVHEVLVRWKGQPASAATWEDWQEFSARYPTLQLEDELSVEGGRDVMWGLSYTRRRRTRDVRRAAERAAARAAPAVEEGQPISG